MRKLPFGYCLIQGKITVDKAQAERLQALFDHYLSGLSIHASRLAAGIPMGDKGCRAMLVNHVYLGNNRFPAILCEDLLRRAEAEVERRGKHLVGKTGWRIPELPIQTRFIVAPHTAPPKPIPEMEPNEYAAWLYAGIQCFES